MGDYVVVKDGAEIRNYKSLPAAKKLADASAFTQVPKRYPRFSLP